MKVALTDDDNTRLHDEAEALRTIHSEFIVAIHDEIEMAGRTVLVLQKAGDEDSMLQCFKQMIATSNSKLNVMATNSHQLAQSISPKQWAATAWMLLNKKDG